MTVYKGPTSNFPYNAYKILGGAHIAFGIVTMVVGIVHATLSYEDRKYFLLSGSVSVWCPLFAIALGVVGVCICKKRYWEVECMRVAFLVVACFTCLAMCVLIIVTVLIDFYYYGIIDQTPEEIFDLLRKRFTGEEAKDGYITLLSLIVAFAGCDLLLSITSVVVAACCSPIYEPDKGQGFQLINKPVQQVQVIEKEKPTQLMIQEPVQQIIQRPQIMAQQQPTHVLQPVQYIEQRPMAAPAPSLMYVNSTMGGY